MATLLKDLYSKEFFNNLSNCLKEVVPAFDKKVFLNLIFDKAWDKLELKERMRHTTLVLGEFFPKSFCQAATCIESLIETLNQKGIKESSVEFMFLADFIEVFGIEDCEASIKLMETVTLFTSCEFAVRPFIIRYPDKMMKQMLIWSQHKNYHVRRLASEGCRPRLPWAMAIPFLKNDPNPLLPVLENLKNDPSEYVRRSVANNLNDVSKDNPEVVMELVKRWKGVTQETDWVVKHASRTLLKEGDKELMALFGFGKVDKVYISNFKVNTPFVKIGGQLEFSFDLTNTSGTKSKLRLEYGIYYQKANGSLSRKVFKISEKEYAANTTVTVVRKQPFKVITTRKLYLGQHQVSLIVNGEEFDKLNFELV